MKKEDIIKDCYSIFKSETPLTYDCGILCAGKCCKGDENTGMLVFPGEETLIDDSIILRKSDNNTEFSVAVCSGKCKRTERPLACRIYPLFPKVTEGENGETTIDVIIDPRANCPLAYGEPKIKASFIRHVKIVGQKLLLNEETALFLKKLSAEIEEYQALSELLKNK